jgi:general stress protein 26
MASTKEIIIEFLNMHRKAVFATATPDGQPHASLMLYAIDDNLNFYFGTKKAFGKYERLIANPRMCLCVIEESLDPLCVVEVEGVASEIPPEELAGAQHFFESKNPSAHYVKGAEDFVMFRIVPTRMKWLDARGGKLKSEDVHL